MWYGCHHLDVESRLDVDVSYCGVEMFKISSVCIVEVLGVDMLTGLNAWSS